MDIEVKEGTGDDEYLAVLSAHLPSLVDQVRPDLIFYQVMCILGGITRSRREGGGGGYPTLL